uniref:Ig-like domain-containing protein n=1 Tax=Sinocyclocheilus rhinocerous TaxID=307959 RepID=A0A673JG62_9TELE
NCYPGVKAPLPPVFKKKICDVQSNIGSPVKFECEIEETPNVTFKWSKSGSEIRQSDKFRIISRQSTSSLELLNPTKDDIGEYSCRASNKHDKASAAPATAPAAPTAPQTVKKLDNLFFIEEPKSIHIVESKLLLSAKQCRYVIFMISVKSTFIAKVGGDPIPNVKWMKGKWRQMTHGGRVNIQQKGQEAKLEIKEVTKSDSGQYRCVASNKHGEIECSTDLNVNEKKDSGPQKSSKSQFCSDYNLALSFVTFRTPSKQKSPKEDKDIDIVELLRNVDPKEYEKYARMYGITDFRGLLQAIEFLKKEKGEESGRPVDKSKLFCLNR